ncbi:DinB family protein [Paenibacillus sedimenti]|uniref:DinB family protein n=1 Tax=Paenibacillus sedimenti TaxID=2770274 RepID=A0A926QM36_9BACL|nr:DinB family protein [Paenibacillus sedimenti]MBD0383232.1 DinB family protein [Paenibacillus sedimenti]
MAVKQNKVLNQFADFLLWVEKLKETDKDLWLKPLSTGKWSLREVLTHIMYWDKNSLEMMVPNMAEDAKLFFVDIEKHNQEAAVYAQTYNSLDTLIDDLIKTRKQLLDLLEEKYDDTTIFTIDNRNYTYKKFVHIFIHHDEHHKKQIEDFLEQEKSA